MTHSPLPYVANGEHLLDARGNVIAKFFDYRDAQAAADAQVDVPALRAEIDRLEDDLADLREKEKSAADLTELIDEAIHLTSNVCESLTDDTATLGAILKELETLKAKLL